MQQVIGSGLVTFKYMHQVLCYHSPIQVYLWVRKFVTRSNFLLDDKFDFKLYEQIVSSQTGTNCTPLAADLFVFCSVVSVCQ